MRDVKPRLYLETTIVSYLTARPSKEPIFAGLQAATRKWWEQRRQNYEVVTSQLVLTEAAKGDADAARRRLAALAELQVMEIIPTATLLGEAILATGLLPPKAAQDAGHIAMAAVNGAHFLLTWNCRHIANPAIADELIRVCQTRGFECPVLCTPYALIA